MISSPRGRSLVSALSLLLVVAFAPAASAQQARIDNLGAWDPPFGDTNGLAVTDDGVVVGDAWLLAYSSRSFRWSPAQGLQDLGVVEEGRGRGISWARSVSADGNVVVGAWDYLVPRAYRWTAETGMRTLEPTLVDGLASEAFDVSADGRTIVGYKKTSDTTEGAFRWTEPSGMVDLGSIGGGGGSSRAHAVSADGSVAVGQSRGPTGGAFRAFKWTEANGIENLGTLGGTSHESVAWDVSADGSVIVGESRNASGELRAFVYTEANGMQELPQPPNARSSTAAYSVSADGRVIAGQTFSFTTGERDFSADACIWVDGVGYRLRDYLVSEYGLNVGAWQLLDCVVSPDGKRLSGAGRPPGSDIAFLITLKEDGDPTTIVSSVPNNSFHQIKVGQTFRASFVATEPDGENLTLSATNPWPTAILTPPVGTTGGSTMAVDFEFSPDPSHFGKSQTATLTFSDESGFPVSRTFTIRVPQNDAPTVAALLPRTIECEDETHTVELSTVVSDPNKTPLTVTWLVDGVVEEIDADVASGSEVFFEFDYPHGSHAVEVEVIDGIATRRAGTTVTVEDTVAPIVVVAGDVIVGTDAGEDYASNVVLPLPEATDASGHAVTLESDEPSTYPLGETIVIWTATDEAGNVATATQRVIVEDRESPMIVGSASARFLVDPGKSFSTAALPLPAVSDNVDDETAIRIESDAPRRLPVGLTVVTFTAADGAGNSSSWQTEATVVNRKPKANAGADVTIETTSERGARVSLDGSASSDPDEQKLKFEWSAPGVTLAGARSATPSGLFPVGRTTAKLTVTDPLGAPRSDVVRVVVKLKNGKSRPRGRQANRAFAAAASLGDEGASRNANASSELGRQYAALAVGYGDAAGEAVRWEEGGSVADAELDYAALRNLQRLCGTEAARLLRQAYVETGEEKFLAAARQAELGAAFAEADMREP